MTLRTLSLALLLSAPLLPACDSGEGDEGGEGPNVDCATVTPPKYSEITAWSKCVTCHSSTLTGAARANAPAAINYDTYDAASSRGLVSSTSNEPRIFAVHTPDQICGCGVTTSSGP